MPEQEQDMLEQALRNLEEELRAFGSAQRSLLEAQTELKQSAQQWNNESEKQRQASEKLILSTKSTADEMISAAKDTTEKLVGSVSESLQTAQAVVEETRKMTEALVPVSSAIRNVNFPMRLDKIDMAVSTQAAALTNLQGATEKGLSGVRNAVATVEQKVLARLEDAAELAIKARRRQRIMLALLVINTVLTAGAVILYALVKFGVLAV